MKNLTVRETAVIEKLRKCMVAKKSELCDHLKISHMTVVRALKKFGYYTSYNKNSSFYTLRDTPDFDSHGLWAYKDICFSQHFTLDKTIASIVDDSESGFTAEELERLLKTNVKNLLSRLVSKDRLSRYMAGRCAVYLSVDPDLKKKQEESRKKRIEERDAKSAIQLRDAKPLPDNLDSLAVIKILVQMIEFPSASAASISQALQRQGVSVTAKNVRSVVEFYSLEKKKARWKWPNL
jgi:predicted transcriptional regulator